MKLVSYLRDEQDQLAILIDGLLYNMDELHPSLPGNMGMFLHYWDDYFPLASAAEMAIKERSFLRNRGIPYDSVTILPPVPFPVSLRYGFGFQQTLSDPHTHAGKAAPLLSFGNHHAVKSSGEIECMPDHLAQLDFELQAAVVICRPGRNIASETAEHYIGGLMILNNFCARALQNALNFSGMGDIKGIDFANSIGPMLVTLDELESFAIPPKEGHIGKTWNLGMSASVNGTSISSGNLGDMDWTFAEMIERASYGVTLFPGDIITSGSINSGSILSMQSANNQPWLKPGDSILLEIENLGQLENSIAEAESGWSLLK